jgi:DNA-binding NarL/FixJ family response regulator
MAGFGFIAFYGGLMISSVLFSFIPSNIYKPLLGVALLTSLTAVYATFSITEAYGKFHREMVAFHQEKIALPQVTAVDGYEEKYDLSPKEREVLEFLTAGLVTREIATKMRITERTVNFHVGSMLKKTGSKNRIELVVKVKN